MISRFRWVSDELTNPSFGLKFPQRKPGHPSFGSGREWQGAHLRKLGVLASKCPGFHLSELVRPPFMGHPCKVHPQDLCTDLVQPGADPTRFYMGKTNRGSLFQKKTDKQGLPHGMWNVRLLPNMPPGLSRR